VGVNCNVYIISDMVFKIRNNVHSCEKA
jgi:hypothetical protein